MNISQEDIANGISDAHIILQVQSKLEVIPPVLTIHAVIGQHRVFKKYAQPVKVLVDAIQHDDVGRNDQEIAGQF